MEKIKNNYSPKTNILGTEKIGKLLKMFAIPCVLSLVIQALYNIVDQIFIGNAGYLPFGNTATGIVYPLTVIALAIGLCIGDGTASSISINQGKNDTNNSHKSLGTGITIGIIASIIMMILSFVFITPILKFFGASGQASIFLADAQEYSTWIIAGFPLFILACVINPIIRADGSPKFAMFAMAIGALVNIVLDPIFIFVFKWGMNGAALATFIGQAITLTVHIIYLFRIKTIKLSIKSFIPDFKLFLTNIKLGISSFLTQFSIVIISIINNIILSKYFVDSVQNAQGILNVAFKVFGIVISIAIGVSAGSQPILGYNYGAGKYDRVKETLKKVLLTSLIVGLVATIIFKFCPEILLSMFGYSTKSGNSSAEILFGVKSFRIYLGFIALTCLIKSSSIFFQAIGKPGSATLIAILRDIVFIVPLAIVLPMISNNAFMWSAPISDIFTTLIAMILITYTVKHMPTVSQEKKTTSRLSIHRSTPGLIICISREHGAGGREIGKKLAQQLNIPFYDKEVAMLTAKESGLATEFIDNLDNQDNAFYELYLSADANQMAISAQDKILRRIADNGSCVIVGRASDYVLRDYNICKIFIYANEEFKTKRIMNNYGDNEELAKENMQKSDRRRAKFYKAISGKDWADKSNFNLCIDSSVGIDISVNTIMQYINNYHSTNHNN